jgi:hypothetical protein
MRRPDGADDLLQDYTARTRPICLLCDTVTHGGYIFLGNHIPMIIGCNR